MILHYIHDPMCSWCWAFRPTWQAIKAELAKTDIAIDYVLGGLAPDSDEPMDETTKRYVQANWQRIQQVVPETVFNYDFWSECTPRRSTYPACRAVIAAREQDEAYEDPMILAIQKAYYTQAKNPSDLDTLCDCAESIGIDPERFRLAMQSEAIEQLLWQNLEQFQLIARRTGAAGFPSLVLSINNASTAVPIDYGNPRLSLDFIHSHL